MNRVTFSLIVCASILLSSCSLQNKFASSFGKRRYTKGFYVDMPGSIHEREREERTAKTVIAQLPAQIANIANATNKIAAVIAGTSPLPRRLYVHNKTAVKTLVITPIKATSIASSATPTSDTKNASPYNKFSLIFFLLAVLSTVIVAILGIALTSSPALFAALYIGLIVTGLLDLTAILSAILSLTHHEDDTDASKIVLIINGVIVLGWLIALIRQKTP